MFEATKKKLKKNVMFVSTSLDLYKSDRTILQYVAKQNLPTMYVGSSFPRISQ